MLAEPQQKFQILDGLADNVALYGPRGELYEYRRCLQ